VRNDWLNLNLAKRVTDRREVGTGRTPEALDELAQVAIEFTEDGWNVNAAGWRAIDCVSYVAGVEVARERCPEPGWYVPPEFDERTSVETRADGDEIALRRAAALGKPVAVVAFSSSGQATVFDTEEVDGQVELVPVGRVPIAASPPPRVPRFIPRLFRPAAGSTRPMPRSSRTRTRPRERRARSSSAPSRNGPGEPADVDPPPRSLARGLRRLFGRAA
jgi:hypothetical protein